MKKDPSFEPYVRWAIGHDWPYHVGRLGSLVDKPMLDEVSKILQWSSKEKKTVAILGENLRFIQQWSERLEIADEGPPEEIVDGYIVSILVRGRYYQELAKRSGGNHTWHPLRNYVLDPVNELTQLKIFGEGLVEAYLAGMICRAAMEEPSEQSAIRCWAENIRTLRTRTLEIPQEGDRKRALERAIVLAKQCHLQFQWRRLDRIMDGVVEYFVVPLVGIAAGVYLTEKGLPHLIPAVIHSVTERFVAPYAGSMVAKIRRAVAGSAWYMRRVAEDGAQRVFAIMKEEVKGQTRI